MRKKTTTNDLTARLAHCAALAMLLTGWTACSSDDDPMAPDGGAKEITILTRTDSEGATETFTGDFTLELWNDGVHTTYPMTYTEGTGWNPIKVDKLGTNVTALAHRGDTVSVYSQDSIALALIKDQSDSIAFNAADVMIATGTVDENDSLSLNFEHCFAKVTFKVYLNDEFQKGTGTEQTPITDLYVMTKDSSIPEVTAYCSVPSNDIYHYYCSAYIPAGTYTEGDTFVKIDIGEFTGDKRLEAKMSEDNYLTLTAGTHYTYVLKVGKGKYELYLDSVSTDIFGGWDNEEDLE